MSDTRGEACGNVVDGHLVIGLAGKCNVSVSSRGNLHARYGYYEVKFTVNMDCWWAYHNYNFILFARTEKLRFLLDRYGVEIEDWEDYLTNLDIEFDIFEYDVCSKSFIGHQFANYNNRFGGSDFSSRSSWKWYTLCGQGQHLSVINNPNRPCSRTDTFTVTIGTEWTPGGYRTFIRVHEFQDDMIVVPKDKINVTAQRGGTGDRYTLTGSAKDAFFTYLDPTDTDTLLEQAAVTHVPLPLNVGAWGWLHTTQHHYIKTRMKIDYIRVWKPADHYSNMEPVYQ